MDTKTMFKTCYKHLIYRSNAKMLSRGPMKSLAEVHHDLLIDDLLVSTVLQCTERDS